MTTSKTSNQRRELQGAEMRLAAWRERERRFGSEVWLTVNDRVLATAVPRMRRSEFAVARRIGAIDGR